MLVIPEYAVFALILALLLSHLVVYFSCSARMMEQPLLRERTRLLVWGQSGLILFSFVGLVILLIQNDFSVAYVAQNSHHRLPLFYRIGAAWGAHEGSMLLWISILNGWMILLLLFADFDRFMLRVMGVLSAITAGFLWFILLTSNPFLRLLPVPAIEGHELNPLLQDPGLVFHPPTLYLGYVGFSVVFAFAIAGLIEGKIDEAWIRRARPWALGAWCFLTLGITMGSWWAYRELGWGGWWFWDPVENASLLPWLVGSALIHSLLVTERRGAFKAWTLFLALTAFILSLLGTFLVRSGVLTSVHAFVNDPARGVFMLGLLLLVICFAIIIFARRAVAFRGSVGFNLLSKETFLLVNNVFFLVLSVSVLLGTLYPLILDALNLGKISVGAPYFNKVFNPIALTLAALSAFAVRCQWQTMTKIKLLLPNILPMMISLLLTAISFCFSGFHYNLFVFLICALAYWITISAFLSWREKHFRLRTGAMFVAHAGLALLVSGIAMTTYYGQERQVSMKLNDRVEIANYHLLYTALNPLEENNYHGVRGKFELFRGEKLIGILSPEKRRYDASGMVMTDAAIDANIWRDIYVSLGQPIQDAMGVRVYYKPCVRWLWTGGFMMMFGGLILILDTWRRRRSA